MAGMFGWATMLPLLGLLSLMGFVKGLRGARVTRVIAAMLVLTAVGLPVVACFRWLPEEQALEVAREELKGRGFTGSDVREIQKTWDGWTVYAEIPNHPRYPVFLSRSGFCTGVGG